MTARLALSIGCPSGIGPEVAVAAADNARAHEGAPAIVLVGDLGVVTRAAGVRGITTKVVPVATFDQGFAESGAIAVLEPFPALKERDARPGEPSVKGGAAQLRWIDVATDAVSAGRADALVTGPVSKEVIARSGEPGAQDFRGHTEHLASRLEAGDVTMCFWSPGLVTSLVTTHIPLSRVATAVTESGIARAILHTAEFLVRLGGEGAPSPTIAIASLNPHAGEGGLLGDEEEFVLGPAIQRATRTLRVNHVPVALAGPIPAESAFRLAKEGKFAAVIAMYHDQATIPMKLLGFGDAVNVTLGLPIVRTSVDHGTGYDRAGHGTADARGMSQAIELAARLVAQRSAAVAAPAKASKVPKPKPSVPKIAPAKGRRSR